VLSALTTNKFSFKSKIDHKTVQENYFHADLLNYGKIN